MESILNMPKPIVLIKPNRKEIARYKKKQIPGFSIIIPSFKRPKLLVKCIEHILRSNSLNSNFKATIYVMDGTPKGKQQTEIINNVKAIAKSSTLPIYLLIETGKSSIINAKIQASEFCKKDGNELFLFIDSDVYVDRNAIDNMVKTLKENSNAAFVSGVSYWNGGKNNGKLCKPEPILETADKNGKIIARDNLGRLKKGKWAYISAIHGVYFAIYKKAYFKIGGYNSLFPNHGENVELSVRCWRNAFPLVYSDSIKARHESESAASIMRAKNAKVGREKFILSTPIKMLYIYKIKELEEIDQFYEIINKKWIDLLFADSDKHFISFNLLKTFSDMIDETVENYKELRYFRKKADNDKFKFMPYSIFGDKGYFKKCLKEAKKK
ncbi:hypothetical protein CMO94_00550 [Candidatus Woesearchaeota archaeon]|nr:hypothetical protein [Candidatus Woesearchaeota archaeon]